MRLALHIGWYAIRDVARNRWGLLYTAFFLIVTSRIVSATSSICQGGSELDEYLPVLDSAG